MGPASARWAAAWRTTRASAVRRCRDGGEVVRVVGGRGGARGAVHGGVVGVCGRGRGGGGVAWAAHTTATWKRQRTMRAAAPRARERRAAVGWRLGREQRALAVAVEAALAAETVGDGDGGRGASAAAPDVCKILRSAVTVLRRHTSQKRGHTRAWTWTWTWVWAWIWAWTWVWTWTWDMG